ASCAAAGGASQRRSLPQAENKLGRVATAEAAPWTAPGGGRLSRMSRYFSGGKRNREAARDLKKREKEARLRRNRDLRAQGIDPDVMDAPAAPGGGGLPEVKLEDVVIGVAPRSRRVDFGPTKLFVGGLGANTTVGDLRTFF